MMSGCVAGRELKYISPCCNDVFFFFFTNPTGRLFWKLHGPGDSSGDPVVLTLKYCGQSHGTYDN